MAARPLLALATAFALAAAGALAAQPAAEPAPEPSAEPEPEARPRLICRGATRTISSRIRTPRRCRTAEQWQDEDERANRLPIGAQMTEGQNDGRAPAQPR